MAGLGCVAGRCQQSRYSKALLCMYDQRQCSDADLTQISNAHIEIQGGVCTKMGAVCKEPDFIWTEKIS